MVSKKKKRKQTFLIIGIMILVLFISIFVGNYSQSIKTININSPLEDSYVNADTTGDDYLDNYGNKRELELTWNVDSSNNVEPKWIYLKFERNLDLINKLNSGDYKLDNAYLELYVRRIHSSKTSFDIYTTSENWDENNINWNNKPSAKILLSRNIGKKIIDDEYNKFYLDLNNLKSQILEAKSLNYLIIPRHESGEFFIGFYSKEDSYHNVPPKLIIKYSPVTIDVYRFSNNECNLINIKPSEKKLNDYDTLNECKINIVEEEPTEEEPTEEEPTEEEPTDEEPTEEEPTDEEPTEPEETKDKNITGNILGIFISIIVLTLLVMIIRNLIKRKK
jgi:hypothetical protein